MLVPPDDVAADHASLLLVTGVVGAVEAEVAQGGELGLDAVQPRGVGRGVGDRRCWPQPSARPGGTASWSDAVSSCRTRSRCASRWGAGSAGIGSAVGGFQNSSSFSSHRQSASSHSPLGTASNASVRYRPVAVGAGLDPQELFTEACLHGLSARPCEDVDALDSHLPPQVDKLARKVAEMLEEPQPAPRDLTLYRRLTTPRSAARNG